MTVARLCVLEPVLAVGVARRTPFSPELSAPSRMLASLLYAISLKRMSRRSPSRCRRGRRPVGG